jgi:hypothetical protein
MKSESKARIAELEAEVSRLREIIAAIKKEYICSHCGASFRPFYPVGGKL